MKALNELTDREKHAVYIAVNCRILWLKNWLRTTKGKHEFQVKYILEEINILDSIDIY